MSHGEKSNGSAETTAQIDTIAYDAAVREGKEIVLEIEAAERGQLGSVNWRTGWSPSTATARLRNLPPRLVSHKCTVDRYRTVYRAWAGKLAPGPNLVPQYAVLRELATHPEREQIIRQNPNITKREAHDKMRALKRNEKEKAEEAQEEDWAQAQHGDGSKSLPLSPTKLSGRLELWLQCATPEQLEPNWQEPSIPVFGVTT